MPDGPLSAAGVAPCGPRLDKEAVLEWNGIATDATSRILIGFHFRHAVEQGRVQGERVGDCVFAKALRPVGAVQ